MRRDWRVLSVTLALAMTPSCGASKRSAPEPGGSEAGTSSGGGGGNGNGNAGAGALGGSGGTAVGGGAGAFMIGGQGGGSGRDEAGGARPDAGSGGTAGHAMGVAASGGTGLPGGAGGAAAGASPGGMGAGGAAGAGAAATLVGCATWKLDTARNATSTAMLSSAGLLLFRPGDASNTETVFNTDDIALSQPGLTGDFDIVVSYADFQPGDAMPFWGPAFQAGAYFHDPSGYVYQATGTVGAGDGNMAVIVPDDDTPIKAFSPIPDPASLVGASGSIEISRRDGIMTAAVTINGITNSVSSTTPYLGEPFVFFMGIGMTGEGLGDADASVLVTNVTVEGGGGSVMSDSFDCN